MVTTAEWLDNNVKDFKDLFASNKSLVTNGQFQMVGGLFQAVAKIVQDELNSHPVVPWGLTQAFARYKEKGFDKRELATAVLKSITEYSNDPVLNKRTMDEYPNTIAAFSPDPGGAAAMKTKFDILWSNSVISATPTISNPTADKVLAIRKIERSACYTVSTSMAKKFLKARGTPVTFTTTPFAGPIANPGIKTEANGTQTVTYNPAVLKDQVSKIGDAISRGYVYIVAVSSGFKHENRPWPDPEHYLLLFAYDGFDRFIFWDSDSQMSDLKSRPQNGQGFGIVRLIDGHFSTGRNSTDFADIDGDGNHNDDPIRHRYQVYTATPYPQPRRK